MFKKVRLIREPIERGNEPPIWLSIKFILVREWRLEILVGICPDKWFVIKDNSTTSPSFTVTPYHVPNSELVADAGQLPGDGQFVFVVQFAPPRLSYNAFNAA